MENEFLTRDARCPRLADARRQLFYFPRLHHLPASTLPSTGPSNFIFSTQPPSAARAWHFDIISLQRKKKKKKEKKENFFVRLSSSSLSSARRLIAGAERNFKYSIIKRCYRGMEVTFPPSSHPKRQRLFVFMNENYTPKSG